MLSLLEKVESLIKLFYTWRALKTQSGVWLVSREMNRSAQGQSTNRRAWPWLCFLGTWEQQLLSAHKLGWNSKLELITLCTLG